MSRNQSADVTLRPPGSPVRVARSRSGGQQVTRPTGASLAVEAGSYYIDMINDGAWTVTMTPLP